MKNNLEQKVQRLFQIYSYGFFAAIFLYLLLPFFPFTADLGRQFPFVSNSAVKVGIIWQLCIYIAGNLSKRSGLIKIFIIGNLLSVLSMVLYLIFLDTSTLLRFPPWSIDVKDFLLIAIGLDMLITLPVIILYIKYRKSIKGKPSLENKEKEASTKVKLKPLMLFLGGLFAIAAVGYHIGPYFFNFKNFFIQLPMVSNSSVKVALLSLCCWYVYKNVKENVPIITIIIVGHVISIIVQLIYIPFSDIQPTIDIIGIGFISEKQLLIGAVLLDLLIGFVLINRYLKYWSDLYEIQFLRPVEFRTLIALSDVIIEENTKKEIVPPKDIAANIDKYIFNMQANKKWIYRVALFVLQIHPVIYGKAPLTELDFENKKKYLEDNFFKKDYKRKKSNFISNYIRALIRIGQQICFVGYYNDPRTWESIGFKTFTSRERFSRIKIPEKNPHPLEVMLPKDIEGNELKTDVCIIGSGAAGSILAYEMAKQGREVLLLEKGKYVEPRYFNEDEVEMIGKLFADGVFQQTEDFKFTILQGNCVGGSTVVNNGVCFDPPPNIIKQWNQIRGQNAGIDEKELNKSVAHIKKFISVQKQINVRLNPGDELIGKGIKKLDPNKELFKTGIVEANISDCLGCGYCNIGCKYGKKLSMLDTVLPLAQKNFPEKLKILAECKVDRLSSISGSVRLVNEVRATLSTGKRIKIKAKTYIVAAGAIASSYILFKSGLNSYLPVGKKLCFNIGSPVYGLYDHVINAHDGLQISHYYKPLKEEGFIFESWWNPPVVQAINMPGWFGEHYKNMQNYSKMLALGALVRSKPTGRLIQALTGGPGILYEPDQEERIKIAKGLKLAGEILFASGAKKVMLNSWSYHTFESKEELNQIDRIIKETDEVALGTGHPQGGNAISKNPKSGVVNDKFQVHGYGNLYVCDASIFPTSLGVNPQLTIMALAHYASTRIK